MKIVKCQSNCRSYDKKIEEHMISEYPEKYPWVICTLCKIICQVDPFDAMCGNCCQFQVLKQVSDKMAKTLNRLAKSVG